MRAYPVDLLYLVTNTPLPKLWSVFQYVVGSSSVSETGVTLSNMQAYLIECDPLPISHQEFWSIMNYFLSRLNKKLLRKRGK